MASLPFSVLNAEELYEGAAGTRTIFTGYNRDGVAGGAVVSGGTVFVAAAAGQSAYCQSGTHKDCCELFHIVLLPFSCLCLAFSRYFKADALHLKQELC